MSSHTALRPLTRGSHSFAKFRLRMTRTARERWRISSAQLRATPSFVIIGAQRAGTTSVYNWLTSHPDVRAAYQKELHFFDGKNYDRGVRWYRSRFPILRSGEITGESTPHMLYNPLSAPRAASDLPPSTHFIVLLRDPVERAISHYWLSRRSGAETEDLRTALSLEAQRLRPEESVFLDGRYSYAHHKFSYVARGDYAKQLQHWFRHVDRSRILVLESELLFNAHELHKLTDRIGLKPLARPLPALNAAERTDTDPDVVACLSEYFQPLNENLFELLERRLWAS